MGNNHSQGTEYHDPESVSAANRRIYYTEMGADNWLIWVDGDGVLGDAIF